MALMGGGKDKSSPVLISPARAMAAGGSTLTQGELEVLTEGDENVSQARKGSRERESDAVGGKKRSNDSIRRVRVPTPLSEAEEVPPPVPPIPVSHSRDHTAPGTPELPAIEFTKPADKDVSSSVTAFLQVGRQVKKVTVEPGLTFASLRVLFMDRFAYNPGQDNFPEIYIRDPSSGVQYELEDIEEVKDKCLLSLNIERMLCLPLSLMF
jgi:hypothetical protein